MYIMTIIVLLITHYFAISIAMYVFSYTHKRAHKPTPVSTLSMPSCILKLCKYIYIAIRVYWSCSPTMYRHNQTVCDHCMEHTNPPKSIKGLIQCCCCCTYQKLNSNDSSSLFCRCGCEPPDHDSAGCCCRRCLSRICWIPRQRWQRWEGWCTRWSRTSRTSRDLRDIVHCIPRPKRKADK